MHCPDQVPHAAALRRIDPFWKRTDFRLDIAGPGRSLAVLGALRAARELAEPGRMPGQIHQDPAKSLPAPQAKALAMGLHNKGPRLAGLVAPRRVLPGESPR